MRALDQLRDEAGWSKAELVRQIGKGRLGLVTTLPNEGQGPLRDSPVDLTM